VVADWSWTGLSHTDTLITPLSSLPFFKAKVDWLASFRSRMGLAIDDTLVYITGGLALGDIKSSAGELGDCPSYCYNNQVSKVKAGWVAGLGVEHKFAPNLSMFSEFLYYDLAKASHSASSPNGTVTYTTQFYHEVRQSSGCELEVLGRDCANFGTPGPELRSGPVRIYQPPATIPQQRGDAPTRVCGAGACLILSRFGIEQRTSCRRGQSSASRRGGGKS
jgi:hypothetical protein